jgi:hypothetical protein
VWSAGPRVGGGRGFLDVAQRNARVQCVGDERVAQGVRPDGLSDSYAAGDPADDRLVVPLSYYFFKHAALITTPLLPAAQNARAMPRTDNEPRGIPATPRSDRVPTRNPRTIRRTMNCPGTLLMWPHTPVTCANAGERADADSRSSRDRPPEKRKVGGSTPPLTTHSELAKLVRAGGW